MLRQDRAPYPLSESGGCGGGGGFAQAGAGGPSTNSAGLTFAKKIRAGAALVWSWEVEMRRGGTRLPGSTPELRERLQVKINAFIRPPAPFQPGRYPHTHTEPPPGLVHSGVNPNFSLDKLGSQRVPARR